MKTHFRPIPVLPVILSLLLVACSVQRSPITGDKRAYGYSWNQEVQLGQEADQQIQQQYGMYDNDRMQQYVDGVAQDVLAVSHMRNEEAQEPYRSTEFFFRVLDSPVVNAFALPGGYVYVTRGLMSHLNNEAQLAVVLGHEIGHVAARHASQRAFEQQMGQIALIGGAIAGQELLGIPGGNILNIGSQATQLLFLQYSRDDERESDQLGVEYAAKQNYVAAEGAEFFNSLERISEQRGQSLPGFLSTHPDPGERSQTIPELAEGWKEQGFEQTVTASEEYMQALEEMIYGVNPRHGFEENGVFYHPDLAFRFQKPDGWQLINQTSMVAVVNQDQNAVVIMQIDSENNSPRASVSQFLNQEGINTLSESSAGHRGMEAHEAIASATTEDGNELNFYLRAIAYDGNIYRFISYTSASQFGNYRSVFESTAQSFDQVTDSDILNRQPMRLQVYRTERSGSFESFLPDPLPRDVTAEDVAILNQVQLDETIESGRWIKIPAR